VNGRQVSFGSIQLHLDKRGQHAVIEGLSHWSSR
jgi:hypothetical protein